MIKLELQIKALKDPLKLAWDLFRIRNCLMATLGVFLGALFVYHHDTFIDTNLLLAMLSAFIITAAGNSINDYFDVEIDKINKPNRPIPSGRISKSDTLMISMILFLLGITLGKMINNYCFALALINSLLLAIYAAKLKKTLLLSNMLVSFLVASTFIYGSLSKIGPQGFQFGDLTLLAVISTSAFLTNFSREILKDIEDIEGDKRNYVTTLPIKYGEKFSKRVASILTIFAIFLSVTPFFISLENFNKLAYFFLIFAADLTFLISLRSPAELSQRIMVFGMFLALLAFLFAKLVGIFIY